MQKLTELEEIRERQTRERKDFVRKQQEQFRKAIEERTNSDKHSQYVGQTSSHGG
jgi:ribosomal protein L32E